MNLQYSLEETQLGEFEHWCIACVWDIRGDSGISLLDYLARALFELRLGRRKQGLTEDELDTEIERLERLPFETKKTEISELACYAILKWERSCDDVSCGKFLDCLVEQGAPEDFSAGIDALVFLLSPDSEEQDLLICGEVKGAAEDLDAPATRPSKQFGSLRNQVSKLLIRFQEEIPQKRLFYDLRRLEIKVQLATGEEEMAERVRAMRRKYIDRHPGVRLLSFLVFRRDWIEDNGKRQHVTKYISNLKQLTDGDQENGLQPWSQDQNTIMLFPIDRWGEEDSLRPIYEALWHIKDL